MYSSETDVTVMKVIQLPGSIVTSPSKSISKEQTKSVQSHLHSNELNSYEAAIFACYDLVAVVRRSRMNLIRASVARTKDASIILETPPSIILFA
jgi:hypothetical protein